MASEFDLLPAGAGKIVNFAENFAPLHPRDELTWAGWDRQFLPFFLFFPSMDNKQLQIPQFLICFPSKVEKKKKANPLVKQKGKGKFLLNLKLIPALFWIHEGSHTHL